MKIVKPGVEFITPIDGTTILKRLEACGRVCYKSEGRITEDSAPKFVANILNRGHEAVLEHCSFTVKFTCDRGVSHEIVRHRLASYCQESTRYCNYAADHFGKEITVIEAILFNPVRQCRGRIARCGPSCEVVPVPGIDGSPRFKNRDQTC